jgi:hypothetical protein
MEKPCMSSDVIIGAGPTTWEIRLPIDEAISSWVSTNISRAEVPPRLLISATCGLSSMAAASLLATASIAVLASTNAICSTPASP